MDYRFGAMLDQSDPNVLDVLHFQAQVIMLLGPWVKEVEFALVQ